MYHVVQLNTPLLLLNLIFKFGTYILTTYKRVSCPNFPQKKIQ